MYLVWVRGSWPHVSANFINCSSVKDANAAILSEVSRPPSVHRLGSAFLQRGIVEERIRFGVKDFVGQWRRLREIPSHTLNFPVFDFLQHRDQTFNIHRFGQTVFDGLLYKRVFRDLAI